MGRTLQRRAIYPYESLLFWLNGPINNAFGIGVKCFYTMNLADKSKVEKCVHACTSLCNGNLRKKYLFSVKLLLSPNCFSYKELFQYIPQMIE